MPCHPRTRCVCAITALVSLGRLMGNGNPLFGPGRVSGTTPSVAAGNRPSIPGWTYVSGRLSNLSSYRRHPAVQAGRAGPRHQHRPQDLAALATARGSSGQWQGGEQRRSRTVDEEWVMTVVVVTGRLQHAWLARTRGRARTHDLVLSECGLDPAGGRQGYGAKGCRQASRCCAGERQAQPCAT